MKRPPGMRPRPSARRADQSRILRDDVASMIGDADTLYEDDRRQLAHEIITVVRERVLREIESYARENVR